MDSPIRVGVVGAGRMPQRAHIPNALAEGCDVVGLADPRANTARRVADHFGIPQTYSDLDGLLAHEDVDALIISVPDPFHAELAIAAARAGKHVFIEKPIATNSDDGRAMVAEAKKAGRLLMIGYQRRHDPAAEIVKGLVDAWAASGEMGVPRYIEFGCLGGDWQCTPDGLIEADDPRPDERASGSLPAWLPEHLYGNFGMFNNGRSHGLDLMRYLFGPPTSVLAAHMAPGPAPVTVFDWAGAHTVFVEGPWQRGRWDERLTVCYDGGWVRLTTPPALLRNMPGTVEVYRASEGVREIIEPPYEWAFRREMAHFVRCIREGLPENPTPEEALDTLVVVEEVFRQAMAMPPPRPIPAGSAPQG